MKQSPSSKRGRSLRSAESLIRLAEGLATSGSRAEDVYWNKKLEAEIKRVILEKDEISLNVALDKLSEKESRAHEELADAIEGCVEFERIIVGGKTFDTLLITAPILAWSTMGLANFNVTPEQLEEISCLLKKHVFNQNAQISLVNYLYSPDQLPESFIETRQLKKAITHSLLKSHHLLLDEGEIKETATFLADQRHLLGVVAVATGEHIFRWQDNFMQPEEIEASWKKVSKEIFSKIMPQCAKDVVLPRAYYVACRDADRQLRKFSINASVSYLSSSSSITNESLLVVIGGCYDRQLEEYRISFCDKRTFEVYHGIVWPLLGPEDEYSELNEIIEQYLKSCGVSEVKFLTQRLPLEYCEDCGSPLYPNIEGEMVHTEQPESDDFQHQHIH